MSEAAARPRAAASTTDTVIIASAVVLSLIGLIALAAVVIAGVSGSTPSAALTWIGMITIPVGFVLLLVEAIRQIMRRRRA